MYNLLILEMLFDVQGPLQQTTHFPALPFLPKGQARHCECLPRVQPDISELAEDQNWAWGLSIGNMSKVRSFG